MSTNTTYCLHKSCKSSLDCPEKTWKHGMQTNESIRSERFYWEKSPLCANLTSIALGSHMVVFVPHRFSFGQLSLKSKKLI